MVSDDELERTLRGAAALIRHCAENGYHGAVLVTLDAGTITNVVGRWGATEDPEEGCCADLLTDGAVFDWLP